jgi:preprotein translocase subunit SecG
MVLSAWIFSAFLGLFITLFVVVALLLILIILIQKGRGGGLASAFGGGGGNTAFGSKTGDVLTWATSIIFGIFLLLAIILNLMTRQSNKPAVAASTGTPPAKTSSSGTGTGTSGGDSTVTPVTPQVNRKPPTTAPSIPVAEVPAVIAPKPATTRPTTMPAH